MFELDSLICYMRTFQRTILTRPKTSFMLDTNMLAARIESDKIEYVSVYMISYLKYYTKFISVF